MGWTLMTNVSSQVIDLGRVPTLVIVQLVLQFPLGYLESK